VLDHRALLAQLDILRLHHGVMLDDEALEPLDVVRQCVNLEHARIIRAALQMRTQFMRVIVIFVVVGLTSRTATGRCPLHRPGRMRSVRILRSQRRALRYPPIDPFKKHRQLRRAQSHRSAFAAGPDEFPRPQTLVKQT
jgi:hypothetical protein